MSRLAHAITALVVFALALCSTTAVFFGLFAYGMGMGAFSGTDFARFSAIAELATLASLVTPLVVLVSGAILVAKRGPACFHGVGLVVGCAPLALFWAATRVLY